LGDKALDDGSALVDGLGKGNRPPDGEGQSGFEGYDAKTRDAQP
jgi:hypothetical protein